eukprot:GCRY01002132.1.p1 GENE.GCRY01002132.1~~GCRY01002132.1.p1  ORF type:complete len:138 (+),score=33.04 GCRY01002132.1:88-501(+)
MEDSDRLPLEQNISQMLKTLHKIRIIASYENLDLDGQDVLTRHLKDYNASLLDFEQKADNLPELEIPFGVIDYLDKNLNPDVFTQDTVLQMLKQNEIAKGKITSFQTYKDKLESLLQQEGLFEDENEEQNCPEQAKA